MHHNLAQNILETNMAPLPLLIDLAPLLITTLGIFEFSLVYCPVRDHFHISSLGNSQEEMSKCESINVSINYMLLCLQRLPSLIHVCLFMISMIYHDRYTYTKMLKNVKDLVKWLMREHHTVFILLLILPQKDWLLLRYNLVLPQKSWTTVVVHEGQCNTLLFSDIYLQPG